MQDKITLTIGMIVRNEQEHLENCLRALAPLMEQVSCELIITDTGSTDSTAQIARRYTDRVEHFAWCNDFAAARNHGLSLAKGEWFMFVDADEYLKDPTPLVSFLNTDACASYKGANVYIKNYVGTAGRYEMQSAYRIFRTAESSFSYPIHETPQLKLPVLQLNAVFDHFGYRYQTTEDLAKKRRRNRVLIEAYLAQHPDDLRMLLSLWDVMENEECDAFVPQLYKAAKRDKRTSHGIRAISQMTYVMIQLPQYFADSLARARRMLSEAMLQLRQAPKTAVAIDLYGNYAICCGKEQRYAESATAAQKYFELYEQYLAGDFDDVLPFAGDLQYISSIGYDEVVLAYAATLCGMGNTKEAVDELINRIALTEQELPIEHKKKCVETAIELVSKPQNPEQLQRLLGWVQQSGEDDLILMAAYCMLVHGQDLAALLGVYDLPYVCSIFAALATASPDLYDRVAAYNLGPLLANGVEGMQIATAMYDAAIASLGQGDHTLRMELIHTYMQLLAGVVLQRFTDDELASEKLAGLDELDRLGYWFAMALHCDSNNDLLGYIRALRQALTACPASVGVIRDLLAEAAEVAKAGGAT